MSLHKAIERGLSHPSGSEDYDTEYALYLFVKNHIKEQLAVFAKSYPEKLELEAQQALYKLLVDGGRKHD